MALPVLEIGKKPKPPHPSTIVDTMGFSELQGLRVLLINMPLRESAQPNTPPQGPGLLAARLREYGADVSILDLNAYRITDELAAGKPNGRWLSYSETAGKISRHMHKYGDPDVIGLSGMITTLRWQQFVSGICRQIVPDAFIVSGGGLATELKDGLFQRGWLNDVDAVAHSEGDDILLVLCRNVLRAKQNSFDMTQVPEFFGIINGRDRFVYAGDRPTNLDALPFAAWDLLEEDVDGNPVLEWYITVPVWGLAANNSSAAPFEMKRSLTAVSSRGCPYACAFCYRGAQGERRYGMRSCQNILDEVSYMKHKYNLDFFGFNDDNFAVDKRRIALLPEAFKPLDGLRWGTHTRLDEAADERAEQMAKAGCVYIGFGAESASANVLERMNKGGFILRPRGSNTNVMERINGFDLPQTMVKGVRNCRDVGIHGNCTWIMGFPGEGLHDLQTSVAFILWQVELATQGLMPGSTEYVHAKASVNQKMFTATAYPGTAMFKDPACRGILTKNFGITFTPDDDPVVDDALLKYVLELDDATKVMHNTEGDPLYFGNMTIDQFLEARSYVDSNHLEKILDMR